MWVSVEVTPGTLLSWSATTAGDVLVVADPHHHDEVDLAGHRVDLADPVERSDRLGDLGDPGDVGLDEDDGGDHGVRLRPSADRGPAPRRRATSQPSPRSRGIAASMAKVPHPTTGLASTIATGTSHGRSSGRPPRPRRGPTGTGPPGGRGWPRGTGRPARTSRRRCPQEVDPVQPRLGLMSTETVSSASAVPTNVASARHSPRARNHTGPRHGRTLVNAATHHGAPRAKPDDGHHRQQPEHVAGQDLGQAGEPRPPTASRAGSGRTSQATPAAAAPRKTAQKTGHGSSVSGQMTCANRGL